MIDFNFTLSENKTICCANKRFYSRYIVVINFSIIAKDCLNKLNENLTTFWEKFEKLAYKTQINKTLSLIL